MTSAAGGTNKWDDDGYWLECIRRSKSNSAISAFNDFAEFVESGQADDRALSGILSALRSLSQHCADQLSMRRELTRLRRVGGHIPNAAKTGGAS